MKNIIKKDIYTGWEHDHKLCSFYDVDVNKYIHIAHTESGRIQYIELCDIRDWKENEIFRADGIIYLESVETEDEEGNICLDIDSLAYYEDKFTAVEF